MTLVRSRAPLRLGFGGGGSDVDPYCGTFGGHVLNATIARFAYAFIGERRDGHIKLAALDRDVTWEGLPEELSAVPPQLALLRAVYQRISRQFLDGKRPAVEVHTYCEAPPGSGLGSSSTVVVALVQAFQELYRLPLGEYEVARLAFEIERIDERLAGGRQDQYAAAFGGVNFIEFFPDDKVIVNPLRISESMRRELEASLLTYFTGVSRESAAIIERQSSGVDAGDPRILEATHAVKREATAMKEALLKGNLVHLAECLNAGWSAKREMASGISNPHLDSVYNAALSAGALGGKVSGAGGGGFMMFLTDPARRPAVVRALSQFGGAACEAQLCLDGAVAWRARA